MKNFLPSVIQSEAKDLNDNKKKENTNKITHNSKKSLFS